MDIGIGITSYDTCIAQGYPVFPNLATVIEDASPKWRRHPR